MNMFIQQKHSLISKLNIWLPKGNVEGSDGSLGFTFYIYTLVYVKSKTYCTAHGALFSIP